MFQNLRHSALFKVLALLALTLLLCIPLSEIDGLIRERGASQNEAAEELARTYSGPQTLVGPLIVVPYVERWRETERNERGQIIGTVERSTEMGHLVFPEKLDLQGRLLPQERYRGIFRIPFYTLDGRMGGRFGAFDPAAIARSEKNSTLELGTPYVALGFSDLRGLEGSPALTVGGESRVPGIDERTWLARGIHAPLAGAALQAWRERKPVDFELKLALVGQERLAVAPLGEETTAHISSPWAHPSFGGRFLAAKREVGEQGFEAQWRVSSLVTGAREQLRASLQLEGRDAGSSIEGMDTFDVSLAQPLNVYAMSTRAAKYGVMFIGLVLMGAYMVELFRRLRLHPVQYGLVGLSIALFFLLLVALSEKIAFWQAYAGAASASVLLLAVYFSAVLQGWRRGLSFAGFVAVLYAALYGLLASESNALLLGALLVFGMLALLMLVTRKVDWYALSRQPEPQPAAQAQAA